MASWDLELTWLITVNIATILQTELEECTEILSQMVNRLYLRTPRSRIIEQAHNVQRRRLEFTAAIAKGLVPPETPPSLKKGRRRRKYSMETEDVRFCSSSVLCFRDFCYTVKESFLCHIFFNTHTHTHTHTHTDADTF